jgi:hypothetical protein
MRKLIITIAIVLAAVSMQAQEIMTVFGGFDNATAVRKTAAYDYTFALKNVFAPYYYTYSVKLNDNTGSNTASLVLKGSLDGVNFKTIQTVNYTGAGSDTTIIANITANPLSYSYLRFTITPSDTIWVKSIFLKVAELK